jgi:hypothetical protein
MPKRYALRQDIPPPVVAGVVTTLTTLEDSAPPSYGTLVAPGTPTLSTTIDRSASTPSAKIGASWTAPDNTDVTRYAVQWSTDSGFTDAPGTDAVGTSCTLEGLKPATLYYVRVAALFGDTQGFWSTAASITTANDTVPPSEPEDIGWDWQADGDLLIIWTPATEANYRDTEIRIWNDSGKSTLLLGGYAAPGFFTWSLAEQRRAQSNPSVLDAAVYIELRSRNWVEYYSLPATPTSQPSKPAPSAPSGLTSSWAGDPSSAGVAGGDCVISWTADPSIRRWVLTIDGVSRDVVGNRYIYTFGANRAEHSNTPDPVLTLGLVGYDALGQVSPSSAATATNGVPDSTTATILGGFSAMAMTIAASAAADWLRYSVRIVKDGSTVETIQTTSTSLLYKATAKGYYQVAVTVVDVFGQSSTEGALSTAVYLDAMTIEEVRAEAIYTDSIGTDFTTSINKTILKDGLTGAGITYAASASAYRWTQIERVNRKLVRRLTLQLGSGSASFYVSTSEDGITWRWFAGVSGVNGYSLTERADEATAQANTSLFSALTYGFAELPGEIDCRYVTVYHRHTSASYRLDECYPRSRLTVDDLDAEIIRGMTILGDQLIVNQLSALTADLGSITAGTVTGGTVQTAVSGARVVLSSAAAGGIIGYNASDTYSVTAGTGTYQVLWSKADGKFYIATGKIVMSADGIRIAADNTSLTDVRWESSGVSALSVNGSYSSGASYGYVVNGVGWGAASKYGQLMLRATGRTASGGPFGPTGVDRQHAIWIGAGTDPAATFTNGFYFTTYLPGIDSGYVKVAQISDSGDLTAVGGLNVGTATAAGTGDVRGSGELQMRGTGAHEISGDLHMTNNGGGTARYLRLYNASETAECLIRDNGGSSVSSLQFLPGGAATMVVESGLVRPNSAAGSNLGNATYYWNDVSYKTLTDRGCLALIPKWELGDGRRVSNVEALLALRAHPAEKTVYGEVKLDYASVPRHSHKPAPVAEEDIYEDDPEERDAHGKPTRKLKHRKGDKMGEDGVEMTALFSVMIGALREQAEAITALQAEIAALKAHGSFIVK